MAQDYKHGIPAVSPIASIIAAATGTLVHTLPATRTCRARKIHIFNHNAATANVSLGTGLAGLFVPAMVAWQVLAGMDLIVEEGQIPDFEFTANVTASSNVAGAAPANVEIQIEVEEYLGTAG